MVLYHSPRVGGFFIAQNIYGFDKYNYRTHLLPPIRAAQEAAPPPGVVAYEPLPALAALGGYRLAAGWDLANDDFYQCGTLDVQLLAHMLRWRVPILAQQTPDIPAIDVVFLLQLGVG